MVEQKLDFIKKDADVNLNEITPSTFVVDGLIRIDTRPTLLCGMPEAGKTTLMYMLALAVSQGAFFLERLCLRGDVLIWQCESSPSQVYRTLNLMGRDPETDARIDVFDGNDEKNTLDNLDKALAAHDYKLVVIETLDDLLRITDVKENSAARRAFSGFNKVMSKYSDKTAFVLLHQYKKGKNDTAGERILGATYIRAKTDAKLYIERVSDDDPRRIFHATVREGVAINKHFLEFDSLTRRTTLGKPVALEYKQRYEESRDRVRETILQYLRNHPGSKKEHVLEFVAGNSDRKREIFDRLVVDGDIVPSGRGIKGDPRLFSVAPKHRDLEIQFGEAA